ncbi:hypothetical protein [Echinicola vietnamensis]|uniref:hypothetical protein n=1 Tax=Echinicola vietnamensis TaxID=390884 RepID=UPI00031EB07B|nr:hypothetical protein [Echinicola vietnamensis]
MNKLVRDGHGDPFHGKDRNKQPGPQETATITLQYHIPTLKRFGRYSKTGSFT